MGRPRIVRLIHLQVGDAGELQYLSETCPSKKQDSMRNSRQTKKRLTNLRKYDAQENGYLANDQRAGARINPDGCLRWHREEGRDGFPPRIMLCHFTHTNPIIGWLFHAGLQ